MVLFAFSLQDQVEKYGAYVGIAAFFGLAVLSLLYFAQAREVKRLREWAGRAPERAVELEQAVAEHAEEVRRVPAPQPVAAQPAVLPEPAVAATNGVVKLKPEEVAALAFARAAGVHEPHEPTPHPAPVPVAAAAVAAAPAPTQTVAAPVEEAAPATSVNGGGAAPPTPPPPATPAARRVDPLPPRRTAAPTRRSPAPPPPRRESSSRAVVLVAVIGVLVLAGAAFAVTQFGGSEDDTPPAPNVVPDPTEEAGAEATATAEPGVTKDNALVMVYNATAVPQLAARYKTVLSEEGYPADNIGVGTLSEAQQAQTSSVLYARGDKAVAEEVAAALGIEEIAQLDDATQTSLASLPADQQKDWNVVAIMGQDKSQ